MKNLNLFYNKIYYDGIGREDAASLKNLNREFLETVFDHSRDFQNPFWNQTVTAENTAEQYRVFWLKTVYPGLLIGTGNPHDAHQGNDEFRLGFSFDYVSGQPHIPGSSVKGVLRAYMKQFPEVVCAITQVTEDELGILCKSIFEGEDVFFDAVLYDSGNSSGHFLGEDYITPHGEATQNPTLVKMVKILPGVKFEFRFRLTDSVISAETTVTVDQKVELFTELLQCFGIGAKTNVGYGILEKASDYFTPVNHEATPRTTVPQGRTQTADFWRAASQNAVPQTKPSQNRSSQPGSTSNQTTTRICPHCGTVNEKYEKSVANKVRKGWIQNVCCHCERKML